MFILITFEQINKLFSFSQNLKKSEKPFMTVTVSIRERHGGPVPGVSVPAAGPPTDQRGIHTAQRMVSSSGVTRVLPETSPFLGLYQPTNS